MRKTLSFALISITLILVPAPVTACLGPPPLSPSVLIARADVIVRATALRYVKTPREELVDLDFSSDGNIQFKVEEVLKGEVMPASLIIEGLLSEVDDFNDRLMPYDEARLRGSCEVYTYKKDAEFLLFLRKEGGKLTPYWASTSPTNEQLRSPDDAWLKWVKEYLQTQEEEVEVEGLWNRHHSDRDLWKTKNPSSSASTGTGFVSDYAKVGGQSGTRSDCEVSFKHHLLHVINPLLRRHLSPSS